MNSLDQITSVEQLADLLRQQQTVSSKEIEPENLRYVIYVRKSTEEDTKQVRSIDDQLTECRLLAQRHNIVVLDENIIKESGSAKSAGMRPLFRKMLERLKKHEIDGVIAWHPDRLSRNMLEAGEIIDLLDSGTICDLKFASHPFTNDAAGKMLLGILFVMAKQYSEKLSADVSRGNYRITEEGKAITYTKHGYIKNRNGMMEPDGNNYAIMYEAFRRKLNGETLEEIADFVRTSGYFRRGKDNKETHIKITVSLMNKIFSDPAYAGVLQHGGQVVNLVEKAQFTPMISVEEYLKINSFKSLEQAFKLNKSKRRDSLKKADLLAGSVICKACNDVTQAGIVKGNTKKYYYFRCETDGCEREDKGTRAKVIVDFVKDFLANKPFTSKAAYSSYKVEIVKIQNQGSRHLNSQTASIKNRIGLLDSDQATIRTNLAKETDEEVKKEQKAELKRIDKELLDARTLLGELKSKKEKIIQAPVTFQEFTAIMDALPERIEKVQSTTELNAIISKIFLNFTVDTKNVVNYTLNKPFDGLLSKNISIGDLTGNRTPI